MPTIGQRIPGGNLGGLPAALDRQFHARQPPKMGGLT